jgi:branched-chain amino acid transport system substrate-binding protein
MTPDREGYGKYGRFLVGCMIAIAMSVPIPASHSGYHPCCLIGFSHGSRMVATMSRGMNLAAAKFENRLSQMGWLGEVLEVNHQDRIDRRIEMAKVLVANQRIRAVLLSAGSLSDDEIGIYAAAQVPLILLDLTERPSASFKNVFRITGRFELQAAVAAEFGSQRGVGSAHVLYSAGSYGKNVADAFVAAARPARIAITGSASIDESREDFGPVVASFQSLKPGMVFFAGGARQAGRLLGELRRRGETLLFVGSDRTASPTIVEQAGAAAPGAFYVTPVGPPNAYPGSRAFAIDYVAKYGSGPGAYSAEAYDAASIVFTAAGMAGGSSPSAMSRTALMEALRKIKLDGVTGPIEFDSNGERRMAPYFVMEIVSSDPKNWEANRLAHSQMAGPS